MSRYTVEDIPLGYAPVPPEMLLHRPKLKDADVRVWCALAMHRNLRTGKTSAGVVRIAEILDVDRSTVTRAVARLIGAGFLLRRRQGRDDESGRFSDAEYTLAVGGKPVQLALVRRRTGEEDEVPDRGASLRHGDGRRDAGRGAPAHTKRRRKEGKDPTGVGVRGKPPHRSDTYVGMIDRQAGVLGVPLDREEKRNLAAYAKGLIEEHDATAEQMVLFVSRFCLRRGRGAKIKPSQAWADVAGPGLDGHRRSPPGPSAVTDGAETGYDEEGYR